MNVSSANCIDHTYYNVQKQFAANEIRACKFFANNLANWSPQKPALFCYIITMYCKADTSMHLLPCSAKQHWIQR